MQFSNILLCFHRGMSLQSYNESMQVLDLINGLPFFILLQLHLYRLTPLLDNFSPNDKDLLVEIYILKSILKLKANYISIISHLPLICLFLFKKFLLRKVNYQRKLQNHHLSLHLRLLHLFIITFSLLFWYCYYFLDFHLNFRLFLAGHWPSLHFRLFFIGSSFIILHWLRLCYSMTLLYRNCSLSYYHPRWLLQANFTRLVDFN